VLIAQERQANNDVYVFNKKGKFAWSSEIRSQLATGQRPASPLSCLMFAGASHSHSESMHQIHVQLPYIKSTVPVVAVFRALGISSDRDIVQCVCYDPDDHEMMDRFRVCFFQLLFSCFLRLKPFGAIFKSHAMCFFSAGILGRSTGHY